MDAHLPPMPALTAMRLLARPSRRATPSAIARLWCWLMEPLDHSGNPALRLRPLARLPHVRAHQLHSQQQQLVHQLRTP